MGIRYAWNPIHWKDLFQVPDDPSHGEGVKNLKVSGVIRRGQGVWGVEGTHEKIHPSGSALPGVLRLLHCHYTGRI